VSSVYRTTVISGKKPYDEAYFFHPQLSSAVHWGEENSEVGDEIIVDEVIQDSTGDFELIREVMFFYKLDD
jgi:hypothetical protein